MLHVGVVCLHGGVCTPACCFVHAGVLPLTCKHASPNTTMQNDTPNPPVTHAHTHRSMTPLSKVFMLSSSALLTRDTMTAILASGHSRIPVYRDGDRWVVPFWSLLLVVVCRVLAGRGLGWVGRGVKQRGRDCRAERGLLYLLPL